jgi:hypothetical protein
MSLIARISHKPDNVNSQARRTPRDTVVRPARPARCDPETSVPR